MRAMAAGLRAAAGDLGALPASLLQVLALLLR